MKVYDGGSDKDNELDIITRTEDTVWIYFLAQGASNQMFISYTNHGDGAPGKGFSATFTFGKKVKTFSFF